MNSAPTDFFEHALEQFGESRAEEIVSHYRMGNETIELRVRSDELQASLTRALSHLATPATASGLTIVAWDSASGGTPRAAWGAENFGPRGEVENFNDQRFRTAYDHNAQSLSMIDIEQRIALFWLPDATKLSLGDAAAPLRNILSWHAATNRNVFVHAAAIADAAGRGVLLTGRGGSGKSSTAAACLNAGWQYLGDDYVLLDAAEPPRIFSVYNSLKIAHDGPVRIDDRAAGRDGEKDVYFRTNSIVRVATSALLIIPQVTASQVSAISAASPGEALRALAPSSLFHFAGAGPREFQRMSQVVRQLPIRRLKLGRDIERVPEFITASLDSVG